MASITIPIKDLNGEKWAELSAIAPSTTHIICGEQYWAGADISLFGGHRVRSHKFKKNVHWRILTGFDLDISAAKPIEPFRRQGQRHNKKR
jgi:hypothetical protein